MNRRMIAAVMVMVGAGGCTLPQTAAPTPTAVSSSPRTWNPMTWRPSSALQLPQLTTEEMAARRTADLIQMASDLRITPSSTPALVHWTLPDEQPVPVSQCMRERGWAAEAWPNGILHVSQVTESQRSAMHLVQYECTATYSIDPRYMTPTPQMYGAVWEYFHDYGIPCLAHFGLRPDEALPAQATFVATKGRYFLYPRNVDLSHEVQIACPQLPPTRAMFP